MDKEEVILLVFQLRLLFNGLHKAWPVIEAIPSQLSDLLGSPLDCMHQAERSGRAGKDAQLTDHDKGVNVVLGCRHDLRRF